MSNSYFYGIYGIRFVFHGPWNDPEIIWHGKSFNYYDLENPLWGCYSEECAENNIEPDPDNGFTAWVKKNAYLAREFLKNLDDAGIYYGTR